MKYIYEHFSEAFIIFVVVVGVISIIMGVSITSSSGKTSKGFLNVLGNQVEESSRNENINNAAALTNIVSQSPPEITFQNDGLPAIKRSVSINLLNYFQIKFTGDENIYQAATLENKKISVTDITNSSGVSILNLYDNQNKTINFPDVGIYTIKLCVSDNENRTTTAIIKIPVKG